LAQKVALAPSPCTIGGVIERRGSWALVGWIALLCAFWPLRARADALVSVQLKDAHGEPCAGKVTLSSADNRPVASCEASAGKCEMHNVPGGTFTVTVQPAKGDPPKPRKVFIPANGKVALVVAAG
jgi:hypothetical protein